MPNLCFDPVAGASGNMILGALFDLGASVAEVDRLLRTTGVTEFRLAFEQSRDAQGILSGYCEVKLHEHKHEHKHEHEHGHGHAHGRRLPEILDLIQAADVPRRAADRAAAVFRRLADAEAAVHGIAPGEVHFHEVGAVDAFVDIVGTCIALELLNVDHIFCSDLKIGHGTVRCAHGILPLPAPATAKLIQGFRITRLDAPVELTTPTGAALLTTLSHGDWTGMSLPLRRVGTGRGTRTLPNLPNVIRAYLVDQPPGGDWVELVETDVDDDTPENLADLATRLLAAGARDVTMAHLLMKKGRPGVRLTIIAPHGRGQEFAQAVLTHATTIGVRIHPCRRVCLPRCPITVSTPWGELAAKRITRPDGSTEVQPEYEASRALAEKAGIPLRHVLRAVTAAPQLD